MTEVFADAHYYIAMLNPSDAAHSRAMAATTQLTRPVVTTLWVLMEVADALSAPAIRGKTHRFLQTIFTDPKTSVYSEMDPWLARGLALYGRRPDKNWSLTDCISFEVMAERGLSDALTADHHFTQAGFCALLLESKN
jgi:uncharacterized protein